jgi:hypothetical protein
MLPRLCGCGRARDRAAAPAPDDQRQPYRHRLSRDIGWYEAPRDNRHSYRADSFGDAGVALDDVLKRARGRQDVEIENIQLATPASAGPVSLPYVESPPAPPHRVPHPLPDGEQR